MKISAEVMAAVPNLHVGVLVLENIDNTADVTKTFDAELAKITTTLTQKFANADLAEYPLVSAWRNIYKNFGEKKARSSIEALIKRVSSGKGLYRVNALVDLYNIASLKYELPAGGEDLDAMRGPLELTVACGTETFQPLGSNETEHPNKGEIIYKSGNIVVCRNFNYRESEITKLTPTTKNAIIVFEDVTGNIENLDAALMWVADHARTLLGATVKSKTVI